MNIKEILHEIGVGASLFFSVFYIFIVLPQIYGLAGIPIEQSVVAISVVIIISTLISLFFTKSPIILAPGISISTYMVFILYAQKGMSWETILAAIFIEGLIFFALTISKLRKWFSIGIPNSFKYGILVGAGLFLAKVGLNLAIPGDYFNNFNFGYVPVIITLISLVFGFFLISRKVKGSFLFILLFSFLLYFFAGYVEIPENIAVVPSLNIYNLDFGGLSKAGILSVVLSLLMIDFFDGLGVSTSLLIKKGHLTKKGDIKELNEFMKVDSITTMISSLFGVGSSVIMLESSIAIHERIKTILPQITVVFLAFITMLFSPLISTFSPSIVSPVLIILGLLFFSSVKMENFKEYDELLPSLLTAVVIPYTMSFSAGIAIGSISYVLVKLINGKIKEVNPAMAIIALLFLLDYLYFFNA